MSSLFLFIFLRPVQYCHFDRVHTYYGSH
jgi:hypothetical protein